MMVGGWSLNNLSMAHAKVLFSLCITLSLLLYNESEGQPCNVEVSTYTGLASENFQWSIAGNIQGKNPNIYSEVVWKKLHGFSLGLKALVKLPKRFYITADLSKTIIVSGAVTDTDYQEDHRSVPSFSAVLNSDRGSTESITGGIGYEFLNTVKVSMIPYIGYGCHRQHLFLLDDADLKSHYKTNWAGPMVTVFTQWNFSSKLYARFIITYHQVNYNAKADWNLIETFKHPVSFKQWAKGYGAGADILFGMNLTPHTSLHFSADFFNWSTGAGIDELYLQTGETIRTKLNEVDRKGTALKLGVTFNAYQCKR
jgi:hypothetical protein